MNKKEYGDYQTPIQFASFVCQYLKKEKELSPTTVIEPTCGIGNFLVSSYIFNANSYIGIELNSNYCNELKNIINDKTEIINTDFFSYNIKEHIDSNTLIIGNPPWVTNSMLSAMESSNLPQKENFKGLTGFDAITGASNFDICEYIILNLINRCEHTNSTIAMLCKSLVARNVFLELQRKKVAFEYCDMIEFNAQKVFNISADACVLIIKLSENKDLHPNVYHVTSFEDKNKYETIKYEDGILKNTNLQDDFNGISCFEWRQGVKHDCSKVMELTNTKNGYVNKQKNEIDIEDTIVFPLIKSSMIKKPIIKEFKKSVIVTQKKIGEETEYIKTIAPKTWKYLQDNIALFKKRKSVIYKKAPDFAMFGVGDYSYSPYKVAISGFYKKPVFSVLFSDNGKPVMLDDTCYFICFDNFNDAYVAMLYLNNERVQRFLEGISFKDSKRPYTKKVLIRIDFNKIVENISLEELRNTEKKLDLQPIITNDMKKHFVKYYIEKI